MLRAAERARYPALRRCPLRSSRTRTSRAAEVRRLLPGVFSALASEHFFCTSTSLFINSNPVSELYVQRLFLDAQECRRFFVNYFYRMHVREEHRLRRTPHLRSSTSKTEETYSIFDVRTRKLGRKSLSTLRKNHLQEKGVHTLVCSQKRIPCVAVWRAPLL